MLKSSARLVRLVAALCFVAALALSPSSADASQFYGRGKHVSFHSHPNFHNYHRVNFQSNRVYFSGYNVYRPVGVWYYGPSYPVYPVYPVYPIFIK